VSEKQLQSNDEIDLFELFLTLWEGKWLILGATLLAAVLGFAYITLTPNNFEAKLNIAPLSANDISDYSALNSIVAADLESTAKTGMFTPRYHSDTLPFFEVTELYLANAFYTVLANYSLSEILGFAHKNLTENQAGQGYQNSLEDASRSFKTSFGKDGMIVITFQGKNEALAQQIIETTLQAVDIKTKTAVIDDFQNQTSEHSARKKFILKELSVEKSFVTANFSKNIEQETDKLKEHQEIAITLGIENPFEKGFTNHAFGNTETYFKGRKALEAEIAILMKRKPNESHLPDLKRINTAMSLIEKDGTAKTAKEALEKTPLSEGKTFKAANYNTVQMQFVYEKKPTLILALSIVLGGFLGMATILVRNAINSRKSVEL